MEVRPWKSVYRSPSIKVRQDVPTLLFAKEANELRNFFWVLFFVAVVVVGYETFIPRA